MLQDVEVEAVDAQPVLEIDPPAPTRPASLTGALVQRGRDRAAYAPEPAADAPAQIEAAAPFAEPSPEFSPEASSEFSPEASPEFSPEASPEFSPEATLESSPEPSFDGDEVPLVFAPRDAAALERSPSRFSDALFVLACCGAFFATFLFALRF